MKKIEERFAKPPNNKQFKDKKLFPVQTNSEIGLYIESLQKSLPLPRPNLFLIDKVELLCHFELIINSIINSIMAILQEIARENFRKK